MKKTEEKERNEKSKKCKEIRLKKEGGNRVVIVPSNGKNYDELKQKLTFIVENYKAFKSTVDYSYDERDHEEVVLENNLHEIKQMHDSMMVIYEIIRTDEIPVSKEISEILYGTALALMKVYVMVSDYELVNTFGAIGEYFAISGDMEDEIDVLREYTDYRKKNNSQIGRKATIVIAIFIAIIVAVAVVYMLTHR